MIFDKDCLKCGKYTFSLTDCVGRMIREKGDLENLRRGKYWVQVTCPHCKQPQAFVIREDSKPKFGTLWPCSWNDEPCTNENCDYCKGKYV